MGLMATWDWTDAGRRHRRASCTFPVIRVKEFLMKSLPILAVLSATLALGVAFGQLPEVKPPPPPISTVAQSVKDEAITAKVTDALSSDAELKGMEFTVATTDAIVTINGTANAADQIARALAIARAVEGVKSVTSILGVKPS
jgi:hyperosmotically inducible protein